MCFHARACKAVAPAFALAAVELFSGRRPALTPIRRIDELQLSVSDNFVAIRMPTAACYNYCEVKARSKTIR